MSLVINWNDIEWQETGDEEDPKARLLGTIEIRTEKDYLMLHVEAYAMTEDSDGIQRADCNDEGLADVYLGVGADGGWQTIPVNGRDYAIIATPFCK